jgi:hypothetical protein
MEQLQRATGSAAACLLLALTGCGSQMTVSDQQDQAQTERCLHICQIRAAGGTLTQADMEVMPICQEKGGKVPFCR